MVPCDKPTSSAFFTSKGVVVTEKECEGKNDKECDGKNERIVVLIINRVFNKLFIQVNLHLQCYFIS